MANLASVEAVQLASADGLAAITLRSPRARFEATAAPSQGGVLSSLRLAGVGELLHLANHFGEPGPDDWTGQAPLLWPSVGRTYPKAPGPDDAPGSLAYGWSDGQREWPLPMHGFARHLPWTEYAHGADAEAAWVTLELAASDASRVFYPADFTLHSTWRLDDQGVEQRVTVRGEDELRFAIGNHITLRLADDDDFNTATLATNAVGRLPILGHGLIGDEPILDDVAGPNPITTRWVRDGALATGPDGWVELRTRDYAARLRHWAEQGAELTRPEDWTFVLHARPHKLFYCPEPWLGRPNALTTGHSVITLPAGQTFEWRWRADIES